MKRLTLLILVAFVLAQGRSVAQTNEVDSRYVGSIFVRGNWPLNTEFELVEQDGSCHWWDPVLGVQVVCRGEQRVPRYVTFWWYNQWPGVCDPLLTGQPEVTLITVDQDPDRVHNGRQALKAFTFWRCHRMGLVANWKPKAGETVVGSAWVKTWMTNCSSSKYGPPLEGDCVTPLTWAHMRVRIGINPLGVLLPDHVTEWGPWTECYNEWCKLETPPVALGGVKAALIVESRVTIDAGIGGVPKHNDLYVDDLALR